MQFSSDPSDWDCRVTCAEIQIGTERYSQNETIPWSQAGLILKQPVNWSPLKTLEQSDRVIIDNNGIVSVRQMYCYESINDIDDTQSEFLENPVDLIHNWIKSFIVLDVNHMFDPKEEWEDFLVPVELDEPKFEYKYSDISIAFVDPAHGDKFRSHMSEQNGTIRFTPDVVLLTDDWYYDPKATPGHSKLARIMSFGGNLKFPEGFPDDPTFKKMPFKALTASVPKDAVYICKQGTEVSITSSLSQIEGLNDDHDTPNAREALRIAEVESKWTLMKNIGIDCIPSDFVSLQRKVQVENGIFTVEISIPACCIYLMNISGLWGSIMPHAFGKHVELGPILMSKVIQQKTSEETLPIGVDLHMIIQPLSKVFNTVRSKVRNILPKGHRKPKKTRGKSKTRKPSNVVKKPTAASGSTGPTTTISKPPSSSGNKPTNPIPEKTGTSKPKDDKPKGDTSLTHDIASGTAHGITTGVLDTAVTHLGQSGSNPVPSETANPPQSSATE